MEEIERIQQLVREGKMSEAEANRLLASYAAAATQDGPVQETLAARHSRSRRAVAGLTAGVLIICALAAALVTMPLRVNDPREPMQISEVPILAGESVDNAISRMERQARQSGNARYYGQLSSLYQMRYSQTQNPDDQRRAVEANARAERYQRRALMKSNPVVFLLASLLIIMAVVGGGAMLLYNGLAKTDERCDRQWGQIQAQLQRRLDLVPALVESVKGAMAHEKETLIAVTEARNRAAASLQAVSARNEKQDLVQIDNDQRALAQSLQRLMVVAEKYPDLKANQNFQTLQDQLEGTENRIATERMRYNEAVGLYNEKLRVFPSNMIATSFSFQPRQYFEAKLDAEEAPAVKF